MKKSLVLMLTILLAASLFAGCGQGGGTTSDAILYYACGSGTLPDVGPQCGKLQRRMRPPKCV